MNKLKNIHPGEILLEEFLVPLGISQNRLATDMQISPRRINEIVHAKRNITADTDLRLSRALGTSEGFWMGLQTDYDLEEKKLEIISQLNKIANLIDTSQNASPKRSRSHSNA
jgi:addiction module HigA family antidote